MSGTFLDPKVLTIPLLTSTFSMAAMSSDEGFALLACIVFHKVYEVFAAKAGQSWQIISVRKSSSNSRAAAVTVRFAFAVQQG